MRSDSSRVIVWSQAGSPATKVRTDASSPVNGRRSSTQCGLARKRRSKTRSAVRAMPRAKPNDIRVSTGCSDLEPYRRTSSSRRSEGFRSVVSMMLSALLLSGAVSARSRAIPSSAAHRAARNNPSLRRAFLSRSARNRLTVSLEKEVICRGISLPRSGPRPGSPIAEANPPRSRPRHGS